MSDTTARLNLPTIRAGQAQKELSHNEALALLDLLTQARAVAYGVDAPPPAPAAGACWIVGAAPTGAWSGHAHEIAGWTEGGWRFVVPTEGMALWVSDTAGTARFVAGAWAVGRITGSGVAIGGKSVLGARRPAIDAPTGGGVCDIEARATLGAILATLRGHGLIEI